MATRGASEEHGCCSGPDHGAVKTPIDRGSGNADYTQTSQVSLTLTSDQALPMIVCMPTPPVGRWTLLCCGIIGAQILLTLAGQFGCGGDNLEFLDNGNSVGATANDNLEISGDLVSLPSAQHLAVFVFINLRDPGTFTSFTDSKNDSISTTKMTFTLRNLQEGNASLYVVDDADQNGQVAASEQFSLLDDEQKCLRGLKSDDSVAVAGITVDFADGSAQSTTITKNGIVCSGTPLARGSSLSQGP